MSASDPKEPKHPAATSGGRVWRAPERAAGERPGEPGRSEERYPVDPVVLPNQNAELDQRPDLPPIVARLVVEIRSDGSRTIARGAMEDLTQGKKVAIQAEGTTPLALALSLAKALLQVPALAKSAARALLPGRSRK